MAKKLVKTIKIACGALRLHKDGDCYQVTIWERSNSERSELDAYTTRNKRDAVATLKAMATIYQYGGI
jgi:hypothetical protein